MTAQTRKASPFMLLLALLVVFLVGCPHPLNVGLSAESAMPVLRGTLLGEGGYTTQATSLAEIASGATVSLIDPTNGATIATSLTQPDGSFALSFGSWKPTSEIPYLLEAVKGLSIGGDPNRPSANVARLRTLVMHSAGSWRSLTRMADGSDVVRINQSTTALCVISGLKALTTSQLLALKQSLVITPGQPDAFIPSPPIAAGEYVSVWSLVDASLGLNQDPVRVVALNPETGIYSRLERGPLVTDLSTLRGEPGTQLVLYGNGFDLTPSNNKVFFNGSTIPAPGVSVNSTGTQLTVPVPADAGVGAIVVQVGKIRCLVAGGSSFKSGAVLETFAGFTEIPPGMPATSYPVKLSAALVPGPGGDLTFVYHDNDGKLLNVSTSGIVSSLVDKFWNSTGAYGEGDLLAARGIRGSVTLARDPQGNLLLAGQEAIYLVPSVDGTYYGKAMLAGHVYAIAGDRRTSGSNTGAIDNVPATSIRIRIGHTGPQQIAVDAQGNLFFGDNCGNSLDKGLLRMLPRASGTYYGQAMTAGNLYTLSSEVLSNSTYVMNVGIDGAGNVYFVRGLSSGNPLRKIALDGSVTDPAPGFTGAASLAVAGDGSVYASQARMIWKIAGGVATPIMAGAAGNSEDGVPLAQAQVATTLGLTVSSGGDLYFADTGNYCIRMIPKTDGNYHGKAMLANRLYVVAGTRSLSSPEGTPAKQAVFSLLVQQRGNIAIDPRGSVYLALQDNSGILVIPAVSGPLFGKAMTAGSLSTIPLSGGSDRRIAVLPSGELYVYVGFMNPPNRYVLKKIALDGSISDVHSEIFAFSFAVDPLGNLYLYQSYKVDMIPAVSGTYFGQAMTAGNRYTVAGNGTQGMATGIATGATLNGLKALKFDAAGNLYLHVPGPAFVSEIRMVPTVAGTYFGQPMSVGNLYTVTSYSNDVSDTLTLDPLGNLYFWMRSGGIPRIRRLSTNGQLSDFAGGGSGGEGSLARHAALSYPEDMVFGPDGALYFPNGKRVMRIY